MKPGLVCDATVDLYDKLATDKATGWLDFFGADQLRELCERVVDEIDHLGWLASFKNQGEGDHEDEISATFEGCLEAIFEGRILLKSTERPKAIDLLKAIELECREAREALDLPRTGLNL